MIGPKDIEFEIARQYTEFFSDYYASEIVFKPCTLKGRPALRIAGIDPREFDYLHAERTLPAAYASGLPPRETV